MDDNNMSDGGNSTPNPITKTTQPITDTADITEETNTTPTTESTSAPASTPASTPTAEETTARTIPVTTPEPDQDTTPTPQEESTTNQPSSTEIEEVTIDTIGQATLVEPKKKRTGLITCIIAVVLVLILGGGFTAFALIKNQPENIAAESFANLLNADKVAVSGDFTLTTKNSTTGTIDSVTVSLDTKTSDNNQAMETAVTISLPDQNKTYSLGLSETMLKNGVIYIKASGLTEVYQNVVSSLLDSYLESLSQQNLISDTYKTCQAIEDFDAYVECLDQAEAITSQDSLTTITNTNLIAETKAQIESIIKKVDDNWLEISIQDILDNELISKYIDQSQKDNIQNTYDCVINTLNNKPSYSNELSDLYMNNKFVKATSADDSYYKISFDNQKLADYLNKISDTKLVSDFASCNNIDTNHNTSISAENVSNLTETLPNIYAKFDGFLTHHLTDIKIEQDTNYYKFSSNINITYPSNLTINAPENSLPIMDVVEEIITDIESITENYNSF